MPQSYADHYNKTTSNSLDYGVAIKHLKQKEFNKYLGVNKSEAIHHNMHHPTTDVDGLYIPSKKQNCLTIHQLLSY